jgi:YidC/Oxa1 family membrane protein insertase
MLLKISYIAYKQHFYLFYQVTFEKAELFSNNLVKDDKVDTIYKTNNKAVLL